MKITQKMLTLAVCTELIFFYSILFYSILFFLFYSIPSYLTLFYSLKC